MHNAVKCNIWGQSVRNRPNHGVCTLHLYTKTDNMYNHNKNTNFIWGYLMFGAPTTEPFKSQQECCLNAICDLASNMTYYFSKTLKCWDTKWYFECIGGYHSTSLLIDILIINPWQKYWAQTYSVKEKASKFWKKCHYFEVLKCKR